MNLKKCLETKKRELFEMIQNQGIYCNDAEKEMILIKEFQENYIQLLKDFKEMLSVILSLKAEEISEYIKLQELGADLIVISELQKAIQNKYGVEINLGQFVENQNLVGVIFLLCEENKDAVKKCYEQEKQLGQKRELPDFAKEYVKKIISEVMKVKIENIEEDCDLDVYGINSIVILSLMNRIEEDFNGVPKTLFFQCHNVEEIAEYFEKHQKKTLCRMYETEKECKQNTITQAAEAEKEELDTYETQVDLEKDEMAIIGLAGSYAKASNVNVFWENLKKAKDCITEIPESRWDYEKYQSKSNKKKVNPHWGGFMDDIDKFDASFFQIAPREAEKMDPQERIFLECVYHTIEDAGYTKKNIASLHKFGHGANVGVFIGSMFEEYQFYGIEEQTKQNYKTLNGSKASIANRISYHFNFQGPCVAVDTMCSSSLTALYLACESLKRGDCESAIVGGVNLSLHPNKYLALSEDNFLSSNGRCQSYGEGGDGYVPGEGVGAVLVKPLKAAEAAGDHIYAVIKGGAINHGGKTNGYSVPNPNAMSDLIERAIKNAKINPRSIGYVEGHGTGTSLGDPIEIAGLNQVYETFTKDRQFCAIGSVKSNIGHCEGAAGIASLTKVILQLKNKMIVPSLHSQVLNSNISFEDSPFYVPQKLTEWKKIQVEGKENTYYPRRAAISSFGAGGSNAHFILEEYVAEEKEIKPLTEASYLFLLSAKTKEALDRMLKEYEELLNRRTFTSAELDSMQYTLVTGREEQEVRFAAYYQTQDELRNALKDYRENKHNIHFVQGYKIFKQKDMLLKEDIQRLVKEKKYRELLELWAKGQRIEESAVYDSVHPDRMSLPGYSFERTSHWFIKNKKKEQKLHPMLDRNVSDLSEQKYECIFTGRESFLEGHVLYGKKVLPASAYIEMLREAVLEAYVEDDSKADKFMQMKNVVWNAPFVIGKEAKSLYIGLALTGENAVYCEIYSVTDVSIVLHCQAEVSFESKIEKNIDIERIKNQGNQKIYNKEEIYSRFKKNGFVYAEAHKSIEEIQSEKEICLARIVSPLSELLEEDAQYLEPGIVDAAVQSCIGLVMENEEGRQMLPHAVNQINIYRGLKTEMWAVLNQISQSKDALTVNIQLCDFSGNVCVELEKILIQIKNYDQEESQSILFAPCQQVKQEERIADVSSYSKKCAIHITDKKTDGLGEKEDLQEYEITELVLETGYSYERYDIAATNVLDAVRRILKNCPYEKSLVQVICTAEEKWIFRGIAKLLRTAERENGNITGQYIEAESGISIEEIKKLLLDNVQTKDRIISYEKNQRKIDIWNELEFNDASLKRNTVWRDDGVYLLTGGISGLAKITMEHIAANTRHAKIIMTGRKSIEEVEGIISQYASRSAEIVYYQTDFNVLTQVEHTVQKIVHDYGKINGIVYGAGITRDCYITEKKNSDFCEVMAPKTHGIVHLDLATKDCELDFFVVYSSIAGALGNAGQADYASANGFLDQYMKERNRLVKEKRRFGRSYSINWPLWKDGGMHVDERLVEIMRKNMAIIPLKSETGMKLLDEILSHNIEQVLVVETARNQTNKAIKALEIETGIDEIILEEQGIAIQEETKLEQKTIDYLKKIVAETTGLSIGEVKESSDFNDLGMNSIWILEINEKLESDLGELSKTLLYEYRCIEDLSEHLLQQKRDKLTSLFYQKEEQKKTKEIRHRFEKFSTRKKEAIVQESKNEQSIKKGHEDIAIIGLAGRYPEAADMDEFWSNLEAGKDCITKIPEGRWSYEKYDSEDTVHYSQYGGFMEDVDKFDPLFFHISPRDARTMDPQERLFLECAYHAMQDAGYTRDNIAPKAEFCDGANVGVYVGVMYEEYQFLGIEEQMKGNPVTLSGSAAAIANRVSYTFNFQGPSVALDTMCSSSLTAIYLACEALKSGTCDAAIAGGVNISIHANKYLALGQNYFTSVDGKCRAFGADGKGYVPGEGVGAIVLKPLSAALEAGDHIYGVIKGGAINHGGKTHGYTVPNPNSQANVIKRAIENANVNAETISYIEAHGTGTLLGDPIEITGLTKAYDAFTYKKQYCAVGSVKSNIGHCEGAAGIAAVTKVLLQMKHKKLVPSLHTAQLNENINFSVTPFYIQRKMEEWKHVTRYENGKEKVMPYRAGVSAFGAGGTNVHLVLEEYMEERNLDYSCWKEKQIPIIIVLSGQSRWQVKEQARKLIDMLSLGEQTRQDEYQIAYTLQCGREAMEERMAFCCNSVEEMISILKQYLMEEENASYQTGVVDSSAAYSKRERNERSEKVKHAIERNDYNQLISLWLCGYEIDWSLLYDGKIPGTISLPLYPFEKERCWATHNSNHVEKKRNKLKLTGEESIFQNHQVNGEGMLPASAYVEYVRKAVEQELHIDKNHQSIRLSSVMWIQPFNQKDAQEAELVITLLSKEGMKFKIHNEDSSVVYCKGNIEIIPNNHPVINKEAARLQCTQEIETDELYMLYEGLCISYSNEHRSLREMYVGENRLVAKISVAQALNPDKEELNPAVLDCALQACAGFLLNEKTESDRKVSIPFQAKEITIYNGTQTEMWVVVEKEENKETQQYKVDLCTSQGDICCQIKGLMTKEYKRDAEKNELITSIAFETTSKVALSEVDNNKETCIFLSRHAPKKVREYLVSYDNVYPLQMEYAEYDYETILKKRTSIKRVLVVMEEGKPSELFEDSFGERQQDQIVSLFRLVRALDKVVTKEQKLALCVASFQTIPFQNEGKCDPINAGVQGLIRSVVSEYSLWDVCMCDFDDLPGGHMPFVSCKSEECNGVLIFRNGLWYQYKLETVQLPAKIKGSPYKQGGVYVIIGGNGGIGQLYSKYLIEQYQADIIWIGRRPMSLDIQKNIDTITDKKDKIQYYSGDASNKEELIKICRKIKERYGQINGVIHSAIVLADNKIAHMEEKEFRKVYDTKLLISLRIAQVFGKETLDFILFFSSLQAISKAIGQANYAAGCAIKDAYAKVIAQKLSSECKVVNWGYWGKQGIVANDLYREKMRRLGADSICGNDAMKFLDKLLAASIDQAGYMKINEFYVKDSMLKDETLVVTENSKNVLPIGITEFLYPDEEAKQLNSEFETELEKHIIKMLYVVLTQNGVIVQGRLTVQELKQWMKQCRQYDKWLLGTVHLLEKYQILYKEKDVWHVSAENVDTIGQIKYEWDKNIKKWSQKPEYARYTNAVMTVVENLPDILNGVRKATDVIFPNGSMELVEPIYKYDKTVYYVNHKLADMIAKYAKEKKISILEIGAGTGGTSYQVFKALEPYEENVKEYCYTDISKAFLSFAEEKYGKEYPYISYRVLDIMEDNIEAMKKEYDIVLATNVIHATKNIGVCIRNIKKLLKANGLVLINEMVENSVLTHTIFGLLEGWWLYEDGNIRLDDCPLLSTQNWMNELRKEGFYQVKASDYGAGQELIAGWSDGNIIIQLTDEKEHSVIQLERNEGNKGKINTTGQDKLNIEDRTREYIKEVLSEELNVSKEKLKSNAQLENYGLDSIVITKLTSKLKKVFTSADNSLFFECQTINEVVERLMEEEKQKLEEMFAQTYESELEKEDTDIEDTEKGKELVSNVRKDIAIVGLSGKYPKAQNVNEFWENLKEGRDCITQIPKERWDWKQYYSEKKGKTNSIYTKWGGFIDGIEMFDPYFFGIVPAEAEKMDPQERLFLQIAYECIEDAGYTPKELSEKRSPGVFVGAMNGYYPGGTSLWSIANRVSYLFNFHGPSYGVDSACSSSLTALYYAIQSIQNGDCDLAIAGGVNLIVSPKHFMRLCDMRMLSSNNACRAFGANADGIVDGEGVGAVLLKPLEDAIADGDHIYAVIKGAMVNSGGKTNGYTIPNPKYQAEVIRGALKKADINPESISYVEAHGTGTALGDPIEIEAISKVFREFTKETQFCSIGSVKTNIGHSESAAGIAALTKVLLQFKHKQLVPSLHASQLNDKIEIEKTPFYIQQELEEWSNVNRITGEVQKRRASISSFGAGGTNVHVILEEYISDIGKDYMPVKTVIAVSAKSEKELLKKAEQLYSYGKDLRGADDTILDMSFTLLNGREAMPCRFAFVAETVEEMVSKCQKILERTDDKEIFIQNGHVEERDMNSEEEKYVEALIEENRFTELAKVWTEGYTVNWNFLFKNQKPSRLSLPTYPFMGSRYWLDEKTVTQKKKEKINYLIHKNCSNYQEYKCKSWFDGTEKFVSGHIVNGQKIMPGAAYLELVWEAAKELIPESKWIKDIICELEEVVWLRPLVITEKTEVVTEIFVDAEERIKFEVASITKDGKKAIYCKGKLQLKEEKTGLPVLSNLQKQFELEQQVTKEKCYRRFEEINITYGAENHIIEWGYKTENEALLRLKLPKEAVENEMIYMIHPNLLDGAMQGILVINIDVDNKEAKIPFEIEQADFYQKADSDMWAYVHRNENSMEESYDIVLYRDKGQVSAVLRGIRMKQSSPVRKEQHVLKEYFVSREQKDCKEQLTKEYEQKVLLMCDFDETFVEQLKYQLDGVDIYSIKHAEHETDTEYLTKCFSLLKTVIVKRNVDQIYIQVAFPKTENRLIYSCWVPALRSAQLELPRLGGQVIELEATMPLPQIIKRVQENSCLSQIHLVTYDKGTRYIDCLKEKMIGVRECQMPIWKEKGVYVIAGGAGGLGRTILMAIRNQVKEGTVVLVGRSSLDESEFSIYEKTGFRVLYEKADCTNKEAIENAFERIIQRTGMITGIIYAAGVIEDSLIVKKTEQQCSQVLESKVTGIQNVDKASRDLPLEFFIICSSIAGVLGNVGQTDYAMANGYLDEFAKYRNEKVELGRRSGQTVSIDLPILQSGGMLKSDYEKEMFTKRTGMSPLSDETALWCLYDSINTGWSQVMYLQGKEEILEKLTSQYTTSEHYNGVKEAISEEQFIDQIIAKVKDGSISKEMFVQMMREMNHREG